MHPKDHWAHNPGEPPGNERFVKPAAIGVAALAVVVLLGVLAARGFAGGSAAPAAGADAGAGKPSVVLIVTDDQRWDTLQYMPNVHELLVKQGVTFRNAFVTDPLCCPSRASILTGQYPHTTGVYDNKGPTGGFRSFNEGGTVATWLDADYSTGLFGKYLNNYEAAARRGEVPLGWDRWVAFDREGYYRYRLNIDGELHRYGESPDDYSTTVLADQAVDFIDSAEGPVFVYWAPAAPHGPALPEGKYARGFSHLAPSRPSNYDERDISDKPGWVQSQLDPLSPRERTRIDDFRRDQLRTLLSVDDAVGRMVGALRETGRLDNTMIVFTSDNGMVWGEHRFTGKNVPWEESIRVPLVVRYDPLTGGIASDDEHLVTNIDFTPTIVDLADMRGPKADGMSFVPLLADPGPAKWRDEFLIEHWAAFRSEKIPTYCAVRTERYLYVNYFWGEDELYDLQQDPRETTNLIADPRQSSALGQLQRAEADLCRPPPPKSEHG